MSEGLTRADYETAATALFLWMLSDGGDEGHDQRLAWNALTLRMLDWSGHEEEARALAQWMGYAPDSKKVTRAIKGLYERFKMGFWTGPNDAWRKVLAAVPHCSDPSQHRFVRGAWQAAWQLLSGYGAEQAVCMGFSVKMDFTSVYLLDVSRKWWLAKNDDLNFDGLALCNLSMMFGKDTRYSVHFARSRFLGNVQMVGAPSGNQAGRGAVGLSVTECEVQCDWAILRLEGSDSGVHITGSTFRKAVNLEFNRTAVNLDFNRVGGLHISSSHFQGDCKISGSVAGRLDIKKSQFARLTLSQVGTTGIVDVVDNKFDQIDLSGARFGDGDGVRSFNMSKCSIVGPAHLAGMMVHGPTGSYAHVQNTNFHGPANLTKTIFEARPMFKNVTFHEGACFDDMKIAQGLSCEGVRFLGPAPSWQNVKAGAGMYMDDCEFEQPPLFYGTELHPDSDFLGIAWLEYERWRRTARDMLQAAKDGTGVAERIKAVRKCLMAGWDDGSPYKNDPAWPYKKYVREWEWLAKRMDDMGRHDERHLFFRYAMLAKRKAQTNWFSGTALLNSLYWATSDYGWSVGRPLFFWVLVFAAAICSHASDASLWDAWRVALGDVMPFAPSAWECEALPPDNGLDCGAGWRPVVKVLGVTCLFLLGLGLRNRFRLRA